LGIIIDKEEPDMKTRTRVNSRYARRNDNVFTKTFRVLKTGYDRFFSWDDETDYREVKEKSFLVKTLENIVCFVVMGAAILFPFYLLFLAEGPSTYYEGYGNIAVESQERRAEMETDESAELDVDSIFVDAVLVGIK
jgi:hypothetical protein